jgi:hypothetical protein
MMMHLTPTIFDNNRIKRMSGAADLTWMSLESGWEVRTAV